MSFVEEIFNLKNKTAVVIGGSGVLGGGMSVALGKAGANVAILYHKNSAGAEKHVQEIKNSGGKAIAVQADAKNKSALENAKQKIVKEFGSVNILVNAPGVNATTPFFEIEEDEWNFIVDTNLKGMFFSCQVFGKQMIEQNNGGSIINISSVVADIPQSKVAIYNISKSGVNSLTRYLAREFAPNNIRVNAILPGIFPAEQNKKVLTEERKQSILNHTPMKRFGNPDELIGVVLWLASERASSFVTGAFITVDGGFSAMRI